MRNLLSILCIGFAISSVTSFSAQNQRQPIKISEPIPECHAPLGVVSNQKVSVKASQVIYPINKINSINLRDQNGWSLWIYPDGHAVVTYSAVILDPSYGKEDQNFTQWQDASLGIMEYTNNQNETVIYNHQNGVDDPDIQ